MNGTGANRIHPNPFWRVIKSRTSGESDHAVLGRGISPESRVSDQTIGGRNIHNGAFALLTHLRQLILHAVPYATKIDGHQVIEIGSCGIGHFDGGNVDTCVVARCIQLAESRHCTSNDFLNLRLIGNITFKSDYMMT